MSIGTNIFPSATSTSSSDNICIGNNQLLALTSATNTTSLGVNNLNRLTSGIYNSAYGTLSLNNITTGTQNLSLGVYNLNALTGANTTIGSSYNTACGNNQFTKLTSGSNNCGLGSNSFSKLIEGSDNTGLGSNSGSYMMNGSQNTCIGSNSGQSFADSNIYNHSSCIGRDSIITASNTIVLGSISDTVVCPNAMTITGTLTATQMIEPFLITPYTTTPSFSMTSGIVYYLATTSTAITSIGFTNIPTTGQTSTIFTFILMPSAVNNPFFLKPGTNFINITPVGGVIVSVPVFGFGNVVLPANYTYLLQQFTIVNTSITTTPNYIAFTNVSGY
jgi:hypothetical protein